MGIDKAKFRKQVVPGDLLVIEVYLINKRNSIIVFSAKAYVNDNLVAEAELKAAVVDRDV